MSSAAVLALALTKALLVRVHVCAFFARDLRAELPGGAATARSRDGLLIRCALGSVDRTGPSTRPRGDAQAAHRIALRRGGRSFRRNLLWCCARCTVIRPPHTMGAFEFVAVAALRAAQLARGCRPRVDGDRHSPGECPSWLLDGQMARARGAWVVFGDIHVIPKHQRPKPLCAASSHVAGGHSTRYAACLGSFL